MLDLHESKSISKMKGTRNKSKYFIVVLALTLAGGMTAIVSYTNAKLIRNESIEVLTLCEKYDPAGTLIEYCKGSDGDCSISIGGSVLKCSGVLIHVRPEER